tara:strand:+ start:137 stop:376 length:240 start_codon:yes stop_codon:yes gene_type:complete
MYSISWASVVFAVNDRRHRAITGSSSGSYLPIIRVNSRDFLNLMRSNHNGHGDEFSVVVPRFDVDKLTAHQGATIDDLA